MIRRLVKQQLRCLCRTGYNRAAVLESFWERVDGIGEAPYGGYHWFETFHHKGVMAIRKKLNNVDVILEIRDARVPFSSYNQELEKLTVEKPKVIVFNRADLSDAHANKALLKFYENLGIPALLISGSGVGSKEYTRIFEAIKMARNPTYYSRRDTTVLVIGMPNVGKSFLINQMRRHFVDALTPTWGSRLGIRRQIANKRLRMGGDPGVTRKVGIVAAPMPDSEGKVVLIDTPGFLSPKLISPLQAKKISLVGLSDFTRTRDTHNKTMSKLVYDTIVHHGMEVGAMTMFRMPFPVPKDFEEFSYRAALTTDCLRSIARHQMPFYTEETFKEGNVLSFNIIGQRLWEGFKKGRFGRVTLDEIPVISDDNYVTAPTYIRKYYEAEQKMRAERREILDAIRHQREMGFQDLNEREKTKESTRLTKAPSSYSEGEEDPEDERAEEPDKPLRVWNIKSKTIDSKATMKHNDYKLSKINTRMRSTNEPLSRLSGALSGNLSEFDTTARQDVLSRISKRSQTSRDKMQEVYTRKKGRTRAFNFNPEKIVQPPRKKLVEIRTFATPNAYNITKATNVLTGEPKIRDSNNNWDQYHNLHIDFKSNIASGA
eukprot:TRINITY_DN15643_c0_g1_i1.p1 TRINITY_DN15643_c0_g1~~TRINITY_DN15643_c0_g1_i1.p1  ORF type:complete len:602 (+),score=95.31 TRINITY_DN15643_c0_g1_i1:58-1863(+)